MSQTGLHGTGLQRLEQLVPQCKAIREGAEYGAALSQATNEVAKAATIPARLENLEPAIRALRGTSHMTSRDTVLELDKLEAAGHALERCVNTDALAEARFSVKDINDALHRLELQVSRAWTARVQAEFAPLQRLGKVLAGIPDTKPTGLDILKWSGDSLAGVDDSVPTATAVASFEETRKKIPVRLKSLGKLGVDATVRSFLQAVANGQATLEDVAPQVLEWLRSRSALSRFRVELH